jgi:PAS domain S-box-containing protein
LKLRSLVVPRLALEIAAVLALASLALEVLRRATGAEASPVDRIGVDCAALVLLAGVPLVFLLARHLGRGARSVRSERSSLPTTRIEIEARTTREAALIDTAMRRQAEVGQAAALEVATALARAADAREAAEAVNDALQRTTGLSRTAVLLFAEDGACRFVGWRGLSEEYRRAVEGHSPWKQDAAEAEPILVPDVAADASLAPLAEVLAREEIATLAFLPVMGKTGVVGKLMLYGARPGAITAAIVSAAHVVAVSLGAAVTRLRMAEALARSESRLRAVIDSAMDAVVSINRLGLVTGWNAQAEATFGWSAPEALGRPLHELILPEEQRAKHLAGLGAYRRRRPGNFVGKRVEVPAVRKDGTRITVELAIAPVHTPEGVFFNGFLRDITEQKRAADELVEARRAAEAASRAKSEFLANMSHEIRTPLTAILGYAELLRDDGDLARAPERRLDTIDTIQGAGQHLLTVISDILDLSKIEAGKMTVEAVETPVVAVLNEVVGLMLPRAAEKGLTLSAELTSALPERVMSDPTRLRQILVNLVGNAVKFTESGGIQVRAGRDSLSGASFLVIEVEDTGPGLSLEQAGRIFSSFGQGDASVTRRHGGSGLGLAISHRLAQLLGGNVLLQRTAPGAGSCFRLELPLVPAPEAHEITSLDSVLRAPARTSAPQRRLAGRVLLAEDGRDNQFLVSYLLRRAGAEVVVAANGRLALEELERAAAEGRPFALLLTDIQMPEMDGYTLARTLRARGERLPIVALTAHAMAEDRQRCLDAGCDDYALKPIDKEKLLATCARWLDEGAGRERAA